MDLLGKQMSMPSYTIFLLSEDILVDCLPG